MDEGLIKRRIENVLINNKKALSGTQILGEACLARNSYTKDKIEAVWTYMVNTGMMKFLFSRKNKKVIIIFYHHTNEKHITAEEKEEDKTIRKEFDAMNLIDEKEYSKKIEEKHHIVRQEVTCKCGRKFRGDDKMTAMQSFTEHFKKEFIYG